MRILMLNNEYPPIGGGTATANYYVVREMVRRGMNVDVVTSTPVGSNRVEIIDLAPNAHIYRIPIDNKNPHYQSERELLRYIWRSFFFIRALYRGEGPKYDLCHAWSGLPAGALALLLKWKRKLPYIVGLRGSDVPGYDVRYRWLYPFLKPPLHLIWGNASALTANSYELRNLALKFRPQETIEVIPNGIDLSLFRQADLLNHSEEKPLTILCVARLVERKGIGDLIKAASLIHSHIPHFKLIIVGRGDKETELRAQALSSGVGGYIEFKGAVFHDQMPDLYASADIFVLPSLYEGMSNAVLEAMAAGLPIITTYTGGTAELVRGNGIIVPKSAPDAIANAILELANNPNLRITMGQRSREIAGTFNWEYVVDRYVDLYQRTLSRLGKAQAEGT